MNPATELAALDALLGPDLLNTLDRFEAAHGVAAPDGRDRFVPAHDLALLLFLRCRHCPNTLAGLDRFLGPELAGALDAFERAADRVCRRDIVSRENENVRRLVRARERWDADALRIAEALARARVCLMLSR